MCKSPTVSQSCWNHSIWVPLNWTWGNAHDSKHIWPHLQSWLKKNLRGQHLLTVHEESPKGQAGDTELNIPPPLSLSVSTVHCNVVSTSSFYHVIHWIEITDKGFVVFSPQIVAKIENWPWKGIAVTQCLNELMNESSILHQKVCSEFYKFQHKYH